MKDRTSSGTLRGTLTDRGRGRRKRRKRKEEDGAGIADLGIFGMQGGLLGFEPIFHGLGAFPDFIFQDGQAPGANPVANLLLGTFLKGFADPMLTSRANSDHNPLQGNQRK